MTMSIDDLVLYGIGCAETAMEHLLTDIQSDKSKTPEEHVQHYISTYKKTLADINAVYHPQEDHCHIGRKVISTPELQYLHTVLNDALNADVEPRYILAVFIRTSTNPHIRNYLEGILNDIFAMDELETRKILQQHISKLSYEIERREAP